MSVKASKSKKKPVVKKAAAKKVISKKKPSTKKPVAKKTMKKGTTKKAVVGKKSVAKKATTKKLVAKKTTSKKPMGLPGLKLAQAYQLAQVETKKLLAPLTKKVSQLKQQHANAQKKLKTEQENLSKLEQKHNDKPSKGLAKQVASAKSKVKLANTTHDKALSAHNSVSSEHAKLQNHLDKMVHLEKNFKQLNTTWDQQNSHVGKQVSAPKAANTNKKPQQVNVVSTSNQSNQSNQNKSNKAKVNLNIENDNAWTKFDQNKDSSVFSKIDKLADYDSDRDGEDKDKQWR